MLTMTRGKHKIRPWLGLVARLLVFLLPLLFFAPDVASWPRLIWGQIARESGWIGVDAVRGKAILQQALPTFGEAGPDPAPYFGWRHTVRSWLYIVFGYDISQPHTLVLAAMPSLHVPPASPSAAVLVIDENQKDAEPVITPQDVPATQVVHAGNATLAALQQRQWGREPLVLIFHTHTSEMYGAGAAASKAAAQSHRFNTTDTGIVRVGDTLARTLNERYGIPVLHSKAIHDFPNHAQSYQRSANTVQQLLKKHPSIRLVLDVHRDGAENVSFIRDVGHQKAAQVMVVVTKPVSYSEQLHPRWSENVQVANAMKKGMEQLYPGLLRPYGIVGRNRYNQHLHPHMVLLEVGNYIDDERYALRSAAMLADVVALVLHDLPAASARAIAPAPARSPQVGGPAVQPPRETPKPGTRRP